MALADPGATGHKGSDWGLTFSSDTVWTHANCSEVAALLTCSGPGLEQSNLFDEVISGLYNPSARFFVLSPWVTGWENSEGLVAY